MNYFISDIHFGHKNILYHDSRPFKSIEENDKTIIENWNKVVSDNDDIYILGDISWYKPSDTVEILKQLKGRKHLIKGNHDSRLVKNKEFQKEFIEITEYKEIKLPNKKRIILCHYPIPCFKNHYSGWYHLYGHVHNSFEYDLINDIKHKLINDYNCPCEMYNVGAMIQGIDYTPRTLEEILEYNKNKE